MILVGGLIVCTNLQADLGLGKLTYLIWVDGFNLMLIALVLVALVQTIVVHYFFTYKADEPLALSIDAISRDMVLFVLFPGLVIGDILLALGGGLSSLGVFLLLATPCLCIGLGPYLVKRSTAKRRSDKAGIIEKLKVATPSDKDYRQTLRRAYDLYDKNASGFIELWEMRELLNHLHGDVVSSKDLSIAMSIVRDAFFVGDRISFDVFFDSLIDISEIVLDREVLERTKTARMSWRSNAAAPAEEAHDLPQSATPKPYGLNA
jgi:hypothetical protein